MKLILDFCGFCGVLLPQNLVLNEVIRCDNCDNVIAERSNRVQGSFTKEQAEKLLQVNGILP